MTKIFEDYDFNMARSLFNFKIDPWETTDLSLLPEYKKVVKTMRDEMKVKSVELGDTKLNAGIDFDYYTDELLLLF